MDNVIESLVDAILAQPLKSNLVEKQHLEEAVKVLNAKVNVRMQNCKCFFPESHFPLAHIVMKKQAMFYAYVFETDRRSR